MARGETTNLDLGVWDEGDNPGAGSKTESTGNVGLNKNWLILDTALGVGHNADGSHKADSIDGPALKTTVADASTIQLTGSPLKLNVKDDGITGAKIAAAAVDGSTLEASAATGAKAFRIKDDGVTGAKLAAGIVDDSTLEATAATGTKTFRVKDAGITGAKISHSNMRTKNYFQFTTAGVDGYAYVGSIQCGSSYGQPMLRAGCATGLAIRQADGTVYSQAIDYAASGAATAGRFAADDVLSVEVDASSQTVILKISGTAVTALNLVSWDDGQAGFITVEVELD